MPNPLDTATPPKDGLNAYLDQQMASQGIRKSHPADSLNDYLNYLSNQPPPPEPPKPRTFGQVATDTGRAIASGVGGLVKSGGTLYGLVTGDMENGATELGDSVQKYWEDGQSEQLKAKKAARSAAMDNADGVLGKAGTAFFETVSDPVLAADMVASNITTLIPGAVVGRLAAGASAARGLAAASKFGPASAAAREAVGKAAGTLGTRAAIGTGALQQGADVSGDVYESVMKKPDAVWANNPEFINAFGDTDGSEKSWQDTKKAFALKTARATMPAATAISVVANAIPGADMLERTLVGGAAKQTIKDGVKYALPKSIAKGALGEMAQETIEEGGGAFAGNVAKQQIIDSQQDLGEQVGENAGMGAAGGFLMGSAGGAFHGKAARPAADPTLAAKQAAAEQAALAKANAIAAAHTAAQTPNSPLSRAAAAANPLGAVPALTPEQIEAEIARLEAEPEIEPNTAQDPATQAPSAINPVAQEDPTEEAQRLIDEAALQAADDQASQRADDAAASAQPYQASQQADTETSAAAPTTAAPEQAALGVLDGDKLNNAGEPFKFEKAAQFALRQYPGHELTKLDSGWVIRPAPTASAAPIISADGKTRIDPDTGEIQSAFEQRQADAPRQQDGDILSPQGIAFTTITDANTRQKELGNDYQVIRLPGSKYVVRAKPTEAVATPTTLDAGPAKADAPAQVPTTDSAVPAPAAEPVNQPDALNVQNTPPASTAEAQTPPVEAPKAGAPDAAGQTAAGAEAGNAGLQAAGVADAKPAPAAVEVAPSGDAAGVDASKESNPSSARRVFATAENFALVEKYKTPDDRTLIQQYESGRDSVKSMNDVEIALAQQPSLPPELASQLKQAHKSSGRDVKRSVVLRMLNITKANQNGTPLAKRQRAETVKRLEADLALFDRAPGVDSSGGNNPEVAPTIDIKAAPAKPEPDSPALQRISPSESEGLITGYQWQGKKSGIQTRMDGQYQVGRGTKGIGISYTPAGANGFSGQTETIHRLPVGADESEVERLIAADKAKRVEQAAPSATENVAPAAPVKWFGDKTKAMGYIVKNKLLKTHQIVDAGKSRFEVREKVVAPTGAPEAFIRAPDGSEDFGEITPEMGKAMRRQAGKIKLQQGVQNEDGTGYGLAHIEANHGDQIRNAGYGSVEEFVQKVASTFNQIWQPGKSAQLLVAARDGKQELMYVRLEPSESGDFYRVNSAFPVSRDYFEKQAKKGAKILWDGSEPASTVAGQQPAYATETPDQSSSQGSPIARGQSNSSLAQPAAQGNPGKPTDTGITAAGQDAIENVAKSSEGSNRYALPDDYKEWNKSLAEGYTPTNRQKLVMDAVAKALDDGAYYNRDVDQRVATALGVDAETLSKNTMNVEGGNFGYDVYHARKAVEAARGNSASRSVSTQMNLKVGDVIGAFSTSDGKKNTGLTVESINDSGLSVVVKGKRGVSTIGGSIGVDAIKAGINRAKERGWRKDGYEEFVSARKTATVSDKPAPISNVIKAAQDSGKLQFVNVGDKPVAKPLDVQQAITNAVSVDGLSNAQVDQIAAMFDKKPATAAKPDAPAVKPSANTVFTDEMAAAARARLKAKLGRLNSGIDPETMMDGITLAGYHIEKGARTFTAYAKAMVADLGDNVKPYLKSWYMGVKYDPRAAAFDGMDTPAVMESVNLDEITAELDQPAESADTAQQDTPNDSTSPTDTTALDLALDEGQRPGNSEQPSRGAQRLPSGEGRGDAAGLRDTGFLFDGAPDAGGALGDGSGPAAVQPGKNGNLAGSRKQLLADDFRPVNGGLTRTGSWFDSAKRNIDLIELAIKIDAEGRKATPDEQLQLSKYIGFGAGEIRNNLFRVPPAYAKAQEPNRLIWPEYVTSPQWKPLAERVAALPREWQQSILQSTQYAHYTSEGMIRGVWSGIERLGFTGGKMFEPGMGIGSFNMLMPQAMHDTSTYTGIEFDAPTALIAKLLSPGQNMLHGDFIKRNFPKDYFDLNVGNPPFSQTKVLGDPNYQKYGFMLHDFFFAKGIDSVRPGGLQVFVTSKGTMDKQSDKARKYLSERADLLGAIRLPSTAFEGNAGTSVVTDVIFLRKRLPGEAPGGMPWNNLATVETKDGPTLINEYFAAHPEMVLGQNRISGNTDDKGRRINSNGMGGERYTVVSYDETPAELDAKFAKAIENLPENAYSIMGQSAQSIKAETEKVDFDPSIKHDGAVYLAADGTLMRVQSGAGRPLENTVKLSDKDKQWFTGYVKLRDMVQQARLAQNTDGDWEAALKKLNKAYDKFRAEHGPIIDFRVQVRKSTDEDGNVVESETRVFKNLRLYREDYDRAILTSLEKINEAGAIVKGPFLLGRTIGKPVTQDIKSIGDALAVSLDNTGLFDLDDVAKRMKMTRDEAIDALDTQIYQSPEGAWQLADEYLSGNVVEKLEVAEEAARLDPSLKRNVEALKKIQPEKLGPSQISAKLGASWIPANHVNDFAAEIEAGAVTFDSATETWQVAGGNLRSQRSAGAEYGTAMRSPSELLEAALNSRSVKVTMTIDKKTVVDEKATTAAVEALKKIKQKFKSWVWTDTMRAAELVESYNKRFNNLAPRVFDGSHLTLPGVSLRFKLHPHQLRAILRQVQTGDTYLAHAVGSGKTIEMIAGGMEQKRLGLIKKPMYVVPNHMLEQFSNEFMELYPLANIMVADDENFSADRRKAFVAAATLNAPDAVVITHDAFQRIGVTEASVAPIRDEILADLEIELSETAKDNDSRVRRSQLEQQIEAVTQRFDRIIGAGGKDATLTFEDMGVDFVYADEAHVYRKLDFHTAQSIKGIDPNGSKRALDMYVKTRILQKQRPGRSMVFASGTPVTNTMGELYTIMRFFAPDELNRAGISTFDGWARQFGEVAPALEPNAAGKYEVVERFSKFDNVPELMSRVRQFMDVLNSENLGALVKRPDLEGGKPNLNVIPGTPQLKAYMEGELARRIEISKAWKPSPGEKGNPDPIVSIITDGRFAALDPRFFGQQLQPGQQSILTVMASKVAERYKAGADKVYFDKSDKPEPIKGSTQIVFYNLGFGEAAKASRGFDSRAAFTKMLTAGGIPRAEIYWFDDANTDAKKEAAFKDMRSGKIKVLIGSAKKMGTGVNVQKRLAALHYQDPPWFPADVEQPHGRIIRQGNDNTEVSIDWYTTKGTYQSTMWQMVARKQRFIDQAFTGDKTMRSMEDLGEASLFEQAAAVASGDPRAIQLAGLKQDVERFERLQAAHASEQISVMSGLRSAEWHAKSYAQTIAKLEKVFKAIGERYYAFTVGAVGGATFTKPGEFGQAIKEAFNRNVADAVMNPKGDQQITLGTMGANMTVNMEQQLDKNQKPTGTFDLSVSVGGSEFPISTSEGMGADVDATGLARRMVNAVNGVESSLRQTRADLVRNETDVNRLSRKLGAPFEYQQEMLEKFAELKQLEEELRQEGLAPSAKPQAESKAEPVADLTAETEFGQPNTKQTGAFEANDTDVVFSRTPPAALKSIPTPAGTAFQNPDIVLSKPRKNVRQPGGDVTRMDFNLNDPVLFTEAKNAGKTASQAREESHVGILTLDFDASGQIKALRNIEVFESKRGRGLAEKTVGAIMAGLPSNASLHVYDILPKAVGFWSKMGAKFARSDDFMEAYLTPQQFKDAYDKRGTGTGAQGNQGQPDAPGYSRREQGDRGNTGSAVPGQSEAASKAKNDIERIVQGITSRWANAPEVVVVYDMTDTRIPEKVRAQDLEQRSGGATGEPEGFFYQGKAYIVASQVSSQKDVTRVLLHETLGHFGLRGVFGQGLKQVLNQVVLARQADVAAKARQYGLDMNDESQRLQAAEEVLAELAQDRPELGIVKRAIAAIRTWLRDNVPGFESMALSDDEIVKNFILPAQLFVERGQSSYSKGASLAFSRSGSGNQLPDAVIAHRLGTLSSHPDYEAAKGGNIEAAASIAMELVDDAMVAKVREAAGYADMIIPVVSIEASGRNKIPQAVARVLADKLGTAVETRIVQANSPKRTNMDGLDRLLSPPVFNGPVKAGATYILIDDTLTQGGTFAALASHVIDSGAKVAGVVALTGKQYSAKISPSEQLLNQVRERFQSVEKQFRAATGYGFDALTESEARYLAKHDNVESVRDRIIEAGSQRGGRPDQGNSGESKNQVESGLDGVNPDIRFSRSTDPSPRGALSTYTKAATDKLNEVFSHPGKITLWDKTVGSMYHLAERSPPFKRVFTAAQNFINDVSFYANDAANLAPTILPRMEDWRDMLKSPVSAADNKAIAAPLLEGTLAWGRDEAGKPVRMDELEARHALLDDEAKAQMLLKKRLVTEGQLQRWKGSPLDIYAGAVRNRFAAAFEVPGVVWSDAELKSMFNLTGEKQADGKMNGQIGLYREFRAATDKSLDNLAKSDLLRFGGKDVADLTDMVMQAKDADEAAVVLRDYLMSLAGADLSRKVELLDSANGMIGRADKARKLKERGYTPLSRFGRYTVDVVVDGERQYFSLFETMADANKMAAQMREEFGDDSVAQGTLSQREFEQFQGITPESLELFGNMLGLDSTGSEAQDQAFQTYLKLTKTNRSAMKRMIHRKGTDGYSDEMGRVLAAFVSSNARQTSAALHLGELGEAVNDIPKSQGELKDHAIGLTNYIKQPKEEAYLLRSIMFAQYLGGSVASAIVNFTQPFTVTFPYLSQFGGAVKSVAALVQAMKDQRDGVKLDAALAQALSNAQEDGVVSPQAIHELQAQAQGRAALRSGDGTRKGDAIAAAQNSLSKLALGWGKLFGFAEQINRRSTFIAAYRMAEAHKPVLLQELANATGDKRANIERQLSEINDPQAFAYKAVNETQFISNKANKARFARGPIGATLMTFKSYSTNYLELLHRLGTQNGPEGKKAMALMLATLFLMAGASGMPGADDLDDLADFFAQRLGYNWSSKKAKQEFIEELFGKTFAGFVENGITGLPGSPIDVSVRMSMGNLLPGTGLLVQKRDNTGDLKELAGPAGDMLQRIFTAGNQVLSGEPGKAALTIAPKAVSNAFKGADMGVSGNYNDAKGYKVIETTPFEAAMKTIGFQPSSVAKVQEANFLHQKTKDFYSMRVQDVNARWARGIYEKDQSQIDEARDMLASWNQKNPEQRMNANMAAIAKRVKEMRMSKDERIAQTAPKALRGQFRKDLAEAQAERVSQ